jgi:hypothetical protein
MERKNNLRVRESQIENDSVGPSPSFSTKFVLGDDRDRERDSVGEAEVFICHAWQDLFLDVIHSITEYLSPADPMQPNGASGKSSSVSLSLSSVVWIDVFSVNHHRYLSSSTLPLSSPLSVSHQTSFFSPSSTSLSSSTSFAPSFPYSPSNAEREKEKERERERPIEWWTDVFTPALQTQMKAALLVWPSADNPANTLSLSHSLFELFVLIEGERQRERQKERDRELNGERAMEGEKERERKRERIVRIAMPQRERESVVRALLTSTAKLRREGSVGERETERVIKREIEIMLKGERSVRGGLVDIETSLSLSPGRERERNKVFSRY